MDSFGLVCAGCNVGGQALKPEQGHRIPKLGHKADTQFGAPPSGFSLDVAPLRFRARSSGS